MTITREDMQLVVTDDGRVWDSMSMIEVKETPEGYQPVVLTVMRNTLDPHYIERWMRRIGRSAALLVTGLTIEGWPYSSFAIGGIVEAVTLAPYDAGSSDATVDTITIQPKFVGQLI